MGNMAYKFQQIPSDSFCAKKSWGTDSCISDWTEFFCAKLFDFLSIALAVREWLLTARMSRASLSSSLGESWSSSL